MQVCKEKKLESRSFGSDSDEISGYSNYSRLDLIKNSMGLFDSMEHDMTKSRNFESLWIILIVDV